MIIDAITHTTPHEKWFSNIDSSEKRLLKEMDDSNVEKSVLVALAGYISNDYVVETCKRNEDRLIPCVSYDPSKIDDVDEVIDDFEKQILRPGYKLLKLHPRLNGYDPLDPRCLAILEKIDMERNPMVVYIDTLLWIRNLILKKPLVETICEIVASFPKTYFVLLHGGGSWLFHVAEAVRGYDNCFIDLSWTINTYSDSSLSLDINNLIRRFDKRIVFGSDFPEVSISKAIHLYYNYLDHICTDSVSNIMGHNLEKIFIECGVL